MCAQELKFSDEFLLCCQRLFKKVIIDLCVYMSLYSYVCEGPSEVIRGQQNPGVTGVCELPDQDAESTTL